MNEKWTISRARVSTRALLYFMVDFLYSTRPLLYFMVNLTKVVKIEKFGILASNFENLCTENENRKEL